ncbi:MAG: type II toxin-antitoxin system VapC family toxin [Coriobacteriia bacterium]|nr:type II toxin-antitoxin system VapC family toxin [Coriobacteriia bacterium]
MPSRLVVLDASVGVKWFTLESGRAEALALLHAAAEGEVTLVVPDLFVYEVLRTVKRKAGDVPARRAAELFSTAGMVTVPPVAHVMRRTLDQAAALGCDVYDACAPAIAAMLDAELFSADRRAHAAFPGVTLIE